MRILLVDDDARLRAVLSRGLAEQGHVVDLAATGPEGLDAACAAAYDVVVLDWMLPGCDGVSVVRSLRARASRIPVLMLTARDAASDIVASLDAGADDYLSKPFSFAVLLARLRALERRGPALQDVRFQVADLVLDASGHRATRGGAPLALTPTEFTLLEVLLRQAGRVVTRQTLIERVWGMGRDIESNTLDVFVKSLRQKVDAPGRPRLIQTIRGVGYSVRAEPEA